jgi:hypothetical protein
MGEGAGVLAAMLSSGIEGASIGVTRFIAQDLDALAIGAFQFGIGFALLPFALRGGRAGRKKATGRALQHWASFSSVSSLRCSTHRSLSQRPHAARWRCPHCIGNGFIGLVVSSPSVPLAPVSGPRSVFSAHSVEPQHRHRCGRGRHLDRGAA